MIGKKRKLCRAADCPAVLNPWNSRNLDGQSETASGIFYKLRMSYCLVFMLRGKVSAFSANADTEGAAEYLAGMNAHIAKPALLFPLLEEFLSAEHATF